MILLHRLAARDFKQLADIAIDFPDRGTVLIEGDNEAGKSSLFEAVYFALYGKTLNEVNIPDMKRFGAESLWVELEFSVDGKRFVIERTVRQYQSVQLTYPVPEGGAKIIRGATEVTKRLLEETGLSASALLNTCYVEQKRLDNLEKLDPQKRREAINELLNLKALTALDATFKITREDEEGLQTLRKRLEVAELDAALPPLLAAERTARRCLAYRRLLTRMEELHVLNEAIDADIHREGEADGRLQEIGHLKETGAHLQRTIDGIDRDLDLRARAWEEAWKSYDEASMTAEELQTLDAGLPTQSAPLNTQLELRKAKLIEDAERAARLPEVLQERQSRAEKRDARAQELAQSWCALLSEAPTPATPQEAMEALPPIRAELVVRLEDLDLLQIAVEEIRLRAECRRLGENVAALRQERKAVLAQQAELMETLEDPQGDPNTLSVRFPELAQAPDRTEEEWDKECEERNAAVKDNRDARRALAITLSLELTIDLETTRQAYAEAQKALDVKRRAGWIVAYTRKTIVDHVMPLTLQNVRQLLPLLTQGRYRDLEWNGDANALMIYDSRAGGYQSKKVFSGGAKDQISLALRLGFALATLPTGSNIRPGWLFLDEPLSSFDRRRTLALVDLLTRGLIRKEFAQIFLVSHSESFDPDRFDYRIRMESGAITENSIPKAVPTQAVVSVKTPQPA